MQHLCYKKEKGHLNKRTKFMMFEPLIVQSAGQKIMKAIVKNYTTTHLSQ